MTSIAALGLGVLIVLLITVVTGYFVAQEFAYVAADRSRLASRAAEGDDVAERTLQITKRTSYLLSGAQLGITVTGLLVGYVAEPLIGQAIADLVGGSSTAWAVALGGVVALGFSTVVQMVLGELFPKNYAIARADEVARWLSRSTQIYLSVFGPVIWVFDKAAELFLRALRIEPVHDVEYAVTASDLDHVLDDARESGGVSSDLATMLQRVIDFPDEDVEHAMIPRAQVDVVRDDMTVGEVRSLMAGGHTRYPVLDQEERIVGVAQLVDLLPLTDALDHPVAQHARDVLVLSPYMTLPDALTEMRRRHEELACVVDEFGGFFGILTIEDLAEEVVGEIADEHDPADAMVEIVDRRGGWEAAGDIHVDEVERHLRVRLPEGDFETLAGLIMHEHGALPGEGEQLDIDLPPEAEDLLDEDVPRRQLRVRVIEVDHYVPSRVHLSLRDAEPEAGEYR